mgnify:CR=1 FL=1
MAGIRPSDFVIKCPPELADAHWQKKKGKVGKMVKTGVGAELKKLHAMLKKVDTLALDPASNPSKSMKELQIKVAEAKKEYMKSIPPIKKQCLTIKSVAEKAEAKLKKMPLGKDASKAAASVAKAADFYSVTCKSLDLDSSVDKVKADIAKKNMLAAKLLKSSLAKYMTGAKKFLSDPTKESWGENIKQQGRSVSNSVAQLAEYRAEFWNDFEKFKGFDLATLKIDDDDNFGKKTSALVKAAAKQVVAIAKFKP